MNKDTDLRIHRSFELLESLKKTGADFAKKESELLRDLHTRRFAVSRKYREETAKAETRLVSKNEETNSQADSERKRIESLYEHRSNRIRRAHTNGIRNLPKRAREAKERWMGELQMKHFFAERTMTEKFGAADKEFAASSVRLDEQRAKLAKLESHSRRSFAGYMAFVRLLRRDRNDDDTQAAHADGNASFATLENRLVDAEEKLSAFHQFLLPRIFSIVPLFVWIAVVALAAFLLGFLRHGSGEVVMALAAACAAIGVFVLHRVGMQQSQSAATVLASTLAEANRTHRLCYTTAKTKHEQDREQAKQEHDQAQVEIQQQWSRSPVIEAEFENAAREKIETQAPRVMEKIDRIESEKINRIDSEHTASLELHKNEEAVRMRELTEAHDTAMAALAAEEDTRWSTLEAEWKHEITPIYRDMEGMNLAAASRFPAWDAHFVETWQPPANFTAATKFAHLDVDLSKDAEGLPKSERLVLPGSPQVSLPLALTFPDQGSLLFETKQSGASTVLGALNNIILRLLSTTPAGKLAFTIIDPVGLGESFAGLMHLSDYEESLINRRIWTQRDQIEERLAELSEHIEKVIQMYLRNEYATITEYNEQAGSVAEKYHFLVVADFPANFSDVAAKRLQSIATSGPRCGIFTLIHWDQRQPMPDGFVPDELRKNSICVRCDKNEFTLDQLPADSGAAIVFDEPPAPDLAVALVHKIGKSSIDSNRVEVPFSQITPKPEEFWTSDTTSEVKIAIGRTGATKHQYLAIGKGTRQHALFAGKTGSGKSTLFHVIITNLALACSPDQIEFYLIDFKKGVEFKCYAEKRLPHARVIAIESDREFGLSVLQRVDEELKRRGDIFRKLGVQDIPGYKRAGGKEPMPRSLLLIDEFQEFFVDDDTIAQTASLLFDRIVRQGRAFGIHVILGSQTLGGAYSLARATLGQMVIRVALQCNEADAYLIMDDNNSAPRLLSRPGEGIYNDAAGAVEGNSPFQVVWLPDDERDQWLDKVHALAEQHHDHHSSPIVFEGNAPSDIHENDLLRKVLADEPTAPPVAPRCWLGAPNSIKGPTEAIFHRQSGNHLLIVGQREEAALSIIGLSLLALAAQYPVGTAKFVLLHSANPGSPDAEFIDRIIAATPHEITVAHGHEITDVMNGIATEFKTRSNGEQTADAPPIFLFIHGLHKFKKLRQEDDFSFSSGDSEASPAAQLNELICEGSNYGIHILTNVDTFNNVNRFMNRKALSEFEMRVVFQMSANDSASLIDSPKASNLGLHRALFYNEHEGTLETFRPYAMPDAEWISQAAQKRRRAVIPAEARS